MAKKITISATSSNPPIEYSIWQGGSILYGWQEFNEFIVSETGNFEAKTRDAQNCSDTFPFTIVNPILFQDDMSSYILGEDLSTIPWANLWDGVDGDVYVEDYYERSGEVWTPNIGDKMLFNEKGINNRYLTYPESQAELADSEVLCLIAGVPSFMFSDRQLRVFIRSGNTETGGNNRFGYFVDFYDSKLSLRMEEKDSSNVIDLDTDLSFTHNKGAWYWVRISAIGSTISAKVWELNTQEPSSWMLQAVDSSIPSGLQGWGRYRAQLVFCDYFAISSGGNIPLPV